MKHIKIIITVFFFTNMLFSQDVKNKIDIKLTSNDKTLFQLISKNPKLELLSKESKWAEGPLILPNGDILWSDIVNNRLLSWNEKEGTKVWLFPAQFHNGHTLDNQNRLVAASHGKRAIERLEKDGTWTILVDLYGDKKLNSPNDLTIDKDGEIWFTDPTFGIMKDDEGYGGNSVIGGEFVYRFDPKTKKIEKLDTKEVLTPNGIALSKDQKTLYLSDSQSAHKTQTFNTRNLVAYDIDENKKLTNGRILAQFGDGIPDGITLDEKGNIWATSGNDIHIISPQGKAIGKITFPTKVANLIFSQKDQKNILYITGSEYLFKLEVLVGGIKK